MLTDKNKAIWEGIRERQGLPSVFLSGMAWGLVEDAMFAAREQGRAEGEEAGTVKAEQNAADCIARLESMLLAAILACINVGAGVPARIKAEADRIDSARVATAMRLASHDLELDTAIDRARRAEAEVARLQAEAGAGQLSILFLGELTPEEIAEFKREWAATDQGRPIPAVAPILEAGPDRRRLDALCRRAGELVDAPATSAPLRRLADVVASLANAAAPR